jgi:hypothetical protein
VNCSFFQGRRKWISRPEQTYPPRNSACLALGNCLRNRQSAQSYSATLTRNSKSPPGAKAENFEEEEEASCQASAAEKASEEDPTG